ncbi:MAG: efflux RND transporter permease subunit [candidate division KSB1 bacterium]|nr:efflux RND transporter permease subunit [candidate division KSB1 bacterium]MDZ7303699.1 efflux RND transporter permease subunit [candidate division KSB1 bacterium]MDZ7313165.1 efflux RND transporter permease subunit [candidate division KSB1 bacterium]
MKLTHTAIKRPVATLVLMATALLLGFFGYSRMPTDFLPDITYPMIKVYVYWRGATPEEINDNIADPVERVMSTVDNLDYLESSSIEGLYTLLVNFEYGTDVDVAYQDVVAKMGLATRKLPPDADPPVMFKADPSQLPVVQLIVTSEGRDLVKLNTWVENVLQDQFLAVKGVAGTEIVGGLRREIRVHLNAERLAAYDLTLNQVIKRLQEENIERLAGRVTEGSREFIVRTTAEFQNLDDIRNVIVANNGKAMVRLKELAAVEDGHQDQRVVTRFNGKPAIKVNILKQADANTVEVAEAVNALITKLADTAPPDIQFNTVENQADYIKGAIAGVRDSAIVAVLLVILVIYLFLGHWRQVLVMLIALPVTILFNFFLMQVGGFSINIFSLGGLVVAMGVVLDNSIVVIENITRQQAESRTIGKTSDSPLAVAATTEVALAVLASTLTFLALFLPFLLIPGLTSLLFKELILTIAGIVLISLLVALTVTPMLTHYLVITREKVGKKLGVFDRLILRANDFYRAILERLLRWRWLVVSVFVLLLAGSFYFFRFIGSEFLPKVDDGRVMIKTILPTGTAVARTDSLLARLESVVRGDPYVEKYFTLSGGKVWGLVTYEIANEGEIDIELVPKSQRPFSTAEYVEKIQPQVMKFMQPGAKLVVSEQKMKGIRKTGESDVEIKVRGFDLTELNEMAQQVAGRMQNLPGLTNVRIGTQITKPEYQVQVNRLRLADLGLSTQSVSASVKTLIDGAVASEFRDASELYDIRVMVPERRLSSRQDVENLYIDATNGLKIPLRTVAQVVPRLGPVEIVRENQIKQIVVSSDVTRGASVGDMAAAVQNALADFPLPEGYSFEFGGQVYLMQESQRTMLQVILFALFFAYVILAIQFNSFKQPLLILLGVPFAFVGVAAALLLTAFPAGATVLIGVIIMTGGIATQGVVLISFINEYRQKGLALREAILEAAPLRVRPILMTQATTILGLLPLAINWGEGGDMLQPMAVAVIGGLFFSLFVTLLLLPNLYFVFERR